MSKISGSRIDKLQIMDNSQDFTRGSILKKLVIYMLPVFAALALQAAYGAIDLLIIGKFGTVAGISGVATGGNIMNLFIMVLGSLTVGVTVIMGQMIGSGNARRIGPILGNAVAFFGILALVLTVVVVVFARPLAIVMQAPDEALDLTVEYVRICGYGFIFIVFYNFISSIFRGIGNSRLPLLFVFISCVVNVGLDLLFIAVFNMNVAGAAWATVIAQAVSVVLSLLIIRGAEAPFSFSIKDIRLNIHDLGFVSIGTPLAIQSALTSLTFLALCAFINRLGLDASSGYGVAQKIIAFIMLIPISIMQSMSPFVAQNVGAQKEDRAKRAMLCGMGIGASVGIIISLMSFFRGDILASWFADDPNVIKMAADYLKGFAPEAVLTSFLFSFNGYFNGHSKSMFVMILGISQAIVIRLPLSYIMSIQPNASLTWIGFAVPVATVLGIIACIFYFGHLQKRIKQQCLSPETITNV